MPFLQSFNNGVNRLGSLFGDPQLPQGGVFGEPQIQQAYNPKLAAAAQLLAGSNSGKGFNEIFANALMASQQARQQAQQAIAQQRQQQIDEQYKQAQISNMNKPPEDPAQIRVLKALQSDPELAASYQKFFAENPGMSNLPAGPATMEWLNKQSPEMQARYERLFGPRNDMRDAPSGYRWNGDGTLTFVPGGPADPRSPTNTRRDREQVTGLRKEFESLKQVENYRSVLPIFERAVTAPNTRAGDLSIVYALGKIFDPTSAVREGELQLSKDAQPWLAKIVREAQSQITGKGALDPTTRAAMVDAMRGQVDALGSAYAQARDQYTSYAEGYGVDPYQVIGPEPEVKKDEKPKAETAAERAKRLGL